MSESDEIRLWCWVLGDTHKRVFSVSIKRSAPIDGLKTAIQERKPSFRDIPVHSIDLYKFQLELPLDDFNEDDAQNINLEDGQKLKSSNDVSFYWMKEPGKVLSVILPRPAGATSSPQNSNFSLNSPPSWLVEIHSELWGRRDFFGKIFRTATVTKSDFTELQYLLETLNPERNSDEYVSEDVLATKSAFLRKRSTGLDLDVSDGLVPRLVLGDCQPPSSDVVDEDGVVGGGDDDAVDNDDDVMDDDGNDEDAAMVIDSGAHLPNEPMAIFPYIIRYVDLTVLQSKKKLRVPRLMLFRNEWSTIIDIFNGRKKGTGGSALFSGQPGIGKTCMLHSILILCIILAQPIVFQDIGGMVFIIGNTVRPLGTPGVSDNDADDVLTLVDADDSTAYRPNNYLFRCNKYRILLTSPKRKEDRKWLTQRVGLHAIFMMNTWSREELVVASLFLQSNDITLKRLQEASRICGNIPRECFAAAVSPRALRDAKATIRNAIDQTKELSNAIINMKVGGETAIHHVFQIRPLFEDRLWHSCLVEPVSDWAFSEMMDVLDNRRAGSAYEFYCAIRGCPDGAALATRALENHFHKFLTSSRTF